MKMAINPTPMPSDHSERILTFNVTIPDRGDVILRSCQIIGRACRNRVSFTETRFVRDVLETRLAHSVLAQLRELRAGPQILALPDFLVELPGLTLYGLHIMVMEARDGMRNAILRVREFVGAVNRAFRIDIGFHEPSVSYGERLATSVLADVCLPILNLCHTLETLAKTSETTTARRVSERAREFEFQTELLKRFILNMSAGHAEANALYLHNGIDPAPDDLTQDR